MGALARHLKNVIPGKLTASPDPGWAAIVAALDAGDHLEAAMGKTALLSTTVDAIIEETAKLVSQKEKDVFESVLAGKKVLPFTTFAKHLFKAGRKFHLITPNYDRLIELATEAAGIGVDSRFVGHLYGRSDPKQSADAHRESYLSGKNVLFRPLPCLCVHKPHGSLDWFEVNEEVVRCSRELDASPVIITPGASKYRESFRWAFDEQRTSGNRGASSATRQLFIGYGFNDDHLEQYLCPGFKVSKPTVILTMELSENGRRIVANSKGVDVFALCAVSSTDLRTRIVHSGGEEVIVDEHLWSLEGFNKGVL